jgi:hypothetical protein
MKAGFLTDLNSRLQLGPQQAKPQEKEPEPPAEKKPLNDARKGRARGPARRKPAAENANAKLPTIPEVKITDSWNVWQIGQDGSVTVGDTKPIVFSAVPEPAVEPKVEEPKEPTPPEPVEKTATEPLNSVPEPPAVAEEVSPSTVEVPENGPADAEASPTAHQPAETTELAPEVTDKQDSPEPSPTGPSGVEHPTKTVPSPIKMEEDMEDMAAFADGKKTSDGDIHPVQSAS